MKSFRQFCSENYQLDETPKVDKKIMKEYNILLVESDVEVGSGSLPTEKKPSIAMPNQQEFGDIIIFLILETILLARMMKVDPFNQPAVEQVKVETKKIFLN